VAPRAPASGASFVAPASITLSATATATRAAITRVEFYQGAVKIGTASSAPYSIVWSGVSQGAYTLTARAFDNIGGSAVSAPVNVSVTTTAPPLVISGTATKNGAPLGGVNFSAGAGTTCSLSDTTTGQYSCTVPQGYTGTVTPSLSGNTFTPSSRVYGNLTANSSAQDYAATAAATTETIWVEDAPPAAGLLAGDGEGWNWVSVKPAAFSGALAHQSGLVSGMHQHYFYNASATLAVGTGETLFAYVFLDAANPPSEVMLQWWDGSSFEHRAYWGANSISFGVDGTASRRFMGALPAAGPWGRLGGPAALVGLEGRVLSGMGFTLFNGRATWDRAGKVSSGQSPPSLTLQSVATGLASPLGIEHAGDSRLFIVQQGGQIRILSGGQVLPTPFLDIANLIVSGGEQGLLGLAFHPNYADAANGFF